MADARSQILEVVRPLLELADEYEISDSPFDWEWEDRFRSLVLEIAKRTGLHREEVDTLFFDYIEMRNWTDTYDCPEAC
jgi:hypothetical protein